MLIDFMAYTRKLPVKKLKLKTFEDMNMKLWDIFAKLASKSKRIDILFDVYKQGNIKDLERIRRGKVDAIEVASLQRNTPLPVETERFWALPLNKGKFQAFFINWIQETEIINPSRGSVPLYPGGGHETQF